MRVLIASDTADLRRGGACIQLWNLARLLRSVGHDVRVFSFDGGVDGAVGGGGARPGDPDWVAVTEPRTRAARKLAKLTHFPRGSAALKRLVDDFDPHLVHVNSNFQYPATVFRALRGRNVIASARDYVWVCPTGWAVHRDTLEPCPGGAGAKCVRHRCKSAPELLLFQAPVAAVRDRLARRVVKRFLAPSRRLAETMRAHGFPAEVLPNPVAADAEPVGDRPAAAREPMILYVGALEEKKGVPVLMDAFRRIAAEDDVVTLELAGRGALREPLRAEAARAGLAGRIRFHGHVARDEVRGLYARAAALVCPSLWMENFPNVVYEAMAHGCPVVGSDRGGIAELLADGRGWLYPAKHADALADRIAEVRAGGPDVASRVAAARRFVRTELAEERFLDGYLRHAAEVTGRPGLAAPLRLSAAPPAEPADRRAPEPVPTGGSR